MTSALSTMVTRIKKEYLDPRGVGVRRFAELTGIRRTRLNRLFAGQEVAAVSELDSIHRVVNDIEEQHRKLEDRQKAAVAKQHAWDTAFEKTLDDHLGVHG